MDNELVAQPWATKHGDNPRRTRPKENKGNEIKATLQYKHKGPQNIAIINQDIATTEKL